jgi:hypothetical protein
MDVKGEIAKNELINGPIRGSFFAFTTMLHLIPSLDEFNGGARGNETTGVKEMAA